MSDSLYSDRMYFINNVFSIRNISCLLYHVAYVQNKYRQAYDMSKGQSTAIVTDSPELIRIRKAQEQLSEVKTALKPKMLCLNHFVG